MLGKLHEYFDPYEITWTRIGGQSTVTLTEPDESFQLSEDGRKLCLFPMDTSIYQCRLRLSRCTSFNESNDISGRCELESPLLGPAISLNVLGMFVYICHIFWSDLKAQSWAFWYLCTVKTPSVESESRNCTIL